MLFRPNIEKLKKTDSARRILNALRRGDWDYSNRSENDMLCERLDEIGGVHLCYFLRILPYSKRLLSRKARKRAKAIVKAFGSPRFFTTLIEALKDDETAIRYAAAEQLGYLKDERAVEYLRELLDNKESFCIEPSQGYNADLAAIYAQPCAIAKAALYQIERKG